MELAPIALFTYNRLWHTQQTVDALKKNILATDSDLYIFSDGGKDDLAWKRVYEVREFIKDLRGFRKIEIIERDTNLGLAANIIDGVSQIVNKYGKIIVLEDDMITSSHFLKYMNEALDLYITDDNVISIHGYMYNIKRGLPDTFFLKGADCWGWATWKRGWELFEADGRKLLNELKRRNLTYSFDFNGKYPYTQMLEDQIAGRNNSWAIRWYASAFLHDKLTLYPGRSLIQNIGNDSSGTHSIKTNKFKVKLNDKSSFIFPYIIQENLVARDRIILFFKHIKKQGLLDRILSLIKL